VSESGELMRLGRETIGSLATSQRHTMTHAAHAARFFDLHASGLLILANAWDAGSARLVHSAGAQAVATSSAALAWAHGFADGEKLPTDLLLASVRAICSAVPVPVSVDIEGGYSANAQTVAELVVAVAQAGAVGINIEDGTLPAELLCDKISAIQAACKRQGLQLFINARTDVFLRNLAAPDQRVAEVLRRAALYRAAGAHGYFVPKLLAPADISAVVAASPMPVNVMAVAGLPAAAQLQALGVRRLSAGSALAEATWGAMLGLSQAFLQTGQVPALAAFTFEAQTYGQLNAVMTR
jgi:2-methylisocitrate lyase-like PEP mutase family enzyme